MKFAKVSAGIGDRSIPSLDGLRAFAVLFVILGHVKAPILDRIPLLIPLRHGELGVAMFFSISGFLITHLLLKEQSVTGGIDLPAFYIRRTLRIFPPFYVFVTVIGVLTLAKFYSVPRAAFLCALTYTWNIGAYQGIWIFGHLWTLSLEEQFYLFWPSLVKHLKKTALLRGLTLFFLLAPLIRAASFVILSDYYRERLHTTLLLLPDHFLVGCIMALALDSGTYDRFFTKIATIRYAAPAALFFFVIDPYLFTRYRPFRPLVGYSAEALCNAIILSYAVLRSGSPLGRLLNWPLLRHIGIISYSLYLWQQMFTGPETARFVPFPANLIAIFLCAESSYWLIERPTLALKRRLLPANRAAAPLPLAV